MTEKSQVTKSSAFYKEFRETNPALILGLVLITFGLYIIHWLYVINKDFKKIDDNAPEPTRGAIILMIIPFLWFFTIFLLKKNIGNLIIIEISEIVGWGLIIFLILKYIFDFCLTFGKITKTSGLLWFSFYFFPICSIIGAFFGFYLGLISLFFLFIVVPAMQAELNSYIQRFHIKKESNLFYN